MSSTVLVTGGAGYIGSHVCKALRAAGYLPVSFDNLSHGHQWAVRYGPFFYGDLHKPEDLDEAFTRFQPSAVIHMAGSTQLRESIENPAAHYFNNVVGTLTLLKAIVKHRVVQVVFSSSAAVYAPPMHLPISEDHPKGPLSPYGRTKWIVEQLFEDFHQAHKISTVSLRYFNAAGADPEGEIGEMHYPESHLIPLLIMTANGEKDTFTILNDNLPTPDGTAIRDFVHVCDLAQGHVLALKWLNANQKPGIFNLGSGRGVSVQEVIQMTQEVTGTILPIKRKKHQIDELSILIADASKARETLGWTPEYSDMHVIIETAIKWHQSQICLEATRR